VGRRPRTTGPGRRSRRPTEERLALDDEGRRAGRGSSHSRVTCCLPIGHVSITLSGMVALASYAFRPVTVAVANGEGWRQIGELGLALLLSALIGLEREIRQKSAGLRTHTLVGVGAAVFMLISKYGFSDVLEPGKVVLDPSRVAAQIVSGVGFLGAGIIFVRRDAVRGLTTAAAIWVTAAVGACVGAGLPILGAITTGVYLVIVATLFPWIVRRLPHSATATSAIRVTYPDGKGILRRLLQVATARGFAIEDVSTQALGPDVGSAGAESQPMVEVTMHVHGRASVNDLAAALSELDQVVAVVAGDANANAE
jgi:putative Mg2+ transporter-C (MgtC) family protein